MPKSKKSATIILVIIMTQILMLCEEKLFSDAVFSALMCEEFPDEISLRHFSPRRQTAYSIKGAQVDIVIYVPSGLRGEDISLITSLRRQNPEMRQLTIVTDLDNIVRTDPRIEYMHRNNGFDIMAEIIRVFMNDMGKFTRTKTPSTPLKTTRANAVKAIHKNLSRLSLLDEFYLKNDRASFTETYRNILEVAFNQLKTAPYAIDIVRRQIATYLHTFRFKYALDLSGVSADIFYILDTPSPDIRQIGRVFFRLADIIFTKEIDIDPVETVVKMKEFINKNYKNNITLGGIAEEVGGNASYLSYLFSKECKETVKEYISRLKITEAKRLLKETNTPIKEIAKILGFSTSNYFVRFFKTNAGIPPQAWRESN